MEQSQRWVVHKFGGTSVGNADCMRKCIEIIDPVARQQRLAIVVSAMGGKPKVTDLLLDLVHAAAAVRLDEIAEKTAQIQSKHRDCVDSMLSTAPEIAERIMNMINKDLRDISDLLRAVQLMRMAHEQILELVSGYGEIWSANILAEALRLRGMPFVFLNARDVLLVGEYENIGTKVFWEESSQKLQSFLAATEAKWNTSADGQRLNKEFESIPLPHLVITGYIASTMDGVATTLKRDGSDFSASIFGKLLRASSITIWTDVSGVYSADPRRVPEAQIIPNVSYSEAIELAYFGAKVIHPKTMAPAIDASIPIYIRNTFEPAHEGTRIFLTQVDKEGADRKERTVCGFTTIDGIALLNLEGTGMIGVPGIAHRLFGALKSAHVSVLFIAQASSEHSICFATKSIHAARAKEEIEKDFFYEMKQGLVSHIRVIDNCSIIAAVGDSMSQMPGVSGLFFGALGGAAINILSISQGCDERNISAVVHTKDATRALRAVHAAFLLGSLDLSIGIIGTGRVGSALLQTLLDQLQVLTSRFGLNIKIRGIANTRKMMLGEDISDVLREKMSFFTSQQARSESVVSPLDLSQHNGSNNGHSNGNSNISAGINVENVKKSLSNVSLADLENAMSDEDIDNSSDETTRKRITDLEVFLQHLKSGSTPHSIIIDASTSDVVAQSHPKWLRMGCHVVTANKRALSKDLDLYNAVLSAARAAHRSYMSEVTIGASLPIRTTLNDILCSGDAVHAIVGIMSVSAGVVLTDICDLGCSFTEAVTRTYTRGLFEDDAFVDLEGTEAAEKLLILAREMGIALRLEDIDVEPLARRRPVTSWANLLGTDTFAAEDAAMRQRAQDALARGCTLRYIQRIECSPPVELGHSHYLNSTLQHQQQASSTSSSIPSTPASTVPPRFRASVRLEEVPLDSLHAMVKGPVYHFSFHTERYAQNPLIIQGPLSDSANTASGILGDILRIARSLGATDRGPAELLL